MVKSKPKQDVAFNRRATQASFVAPRNRESGGGWKDRWSQSWLDSLPNGGRFYIVEKWWYWG